jgi:hypothetical protein
MRQSGLLMGAPTIPAETKANLPQTLEQARRRFPRQAWVLVFPHGGITYPVLGAKKRLRSVDI